MFCDLYKCLWLASIHKKYELCNTSQLKDMVHIRVANNEPCLYIKKSQSLFLFVRLDDLQDNDVAREWVIDWWSQDYYLDKREDGLCWGSWQEVAEWSCDTLTKGHKRTVSDVCEAQFRVYWDHTVWGITDTGTVSGTSNRARRLCSRAIASAECLHRSDPHWHVKYLLLMSQKRSP